MVRTPLSVSGSFGQPLLTTVSMPDVSAVAFAINLLVCIQAWELPRRSSAPMNRTFVLPVGGGPAAPDACKAVITPATLTRQATARPIPERLDNLPIGIPRVNFRQSW